LADAGGARRRAEDGVVPDTVAREEDLAVAVLKARSLCRIRLL
jgi:hypothetical protein